MKTRKIFLLLIVVLGWFSLLAQLVLLLKAGQVSLGEYLVRYFSFFTILTNLLVAICFTTILIECPKKAFYFFNEPGVQTSVIVYISLVGVIYNLILRRLWHSEGLQYLLHDILHSIIPGLCIVYWWVWCDAKGLQWKNIYGWLIYPFIYTLFVLFWGNVSGWYPYPFFDIQKIGIFLVIRNTVLLLLVFVFFSVIFIFAGKKKAN
jgi:hypothetical protein